MHLAPWTPGVVSVEVSTITDNADIPSRIHKQSTDWSLSHVASHVSTLARGYGARGSGPDGGGVDVGSASSLGVGFWEFQV